MDIMEIEKEKKLSVKNLSTSPSYLTLVASNSQEVGDFKLSTGSEFDLFVQMLPKGILVFSVYDETNLTPSFTLNNGVVGGELQNWFQLLNLGAVKLSINGQIQGSDNTLNIQRTGISACSLELDETALQTASPLEFNGVFQGDNSIVFQLNNAGTSVSLLQILKFTGYINAPNSGWADILPKVFSNVLNCGLSTDSSIIFNPNDYGNIVTIALVSLPGNLNIFKELQLNDVELAFCRKARSSDDIWMNHETSCYFDANLGVNVSSTETFEASVRVAMYNDGQGKFSFVPQLTGVAADQILVKLLNCIFPNSGILVEQLSDLGITINLVSQANISFDLGVPELKSIEIITEAYIFDYKLIVHASCPNELIWGELSPDMIVPTTVPNPDDSTPVVSTIGVNDILEEKHNIALPDETFSTWKVANFLFSASATGGYYNFDFGLNNGSDGLWKFNEAITLTDIKCSLVKNAGTTEVGLEASIQLANSLMGIKAQYLNKDGISTWVFTGYVSYVPLSNLTYLFLQEVTGNGAISDFPQVGIGDVNCNFNLNTRTLSFDAHFYIGSEEFKVSANDNTQDFKYLSAQWTGDSTSISLKSLVLGLGLDLPLPDIVDELSLNLTSASFVYYMDTSAAAVSSKILAFSVKIAQNSNELDAQLIMYQDPADPNKKFQSLFWLQYELNSVLPPIPTVGTVSLPLKNIQFLFTSATIGAQQYAAIAQSIAKLNVISNDPNWKSNSLIPLPDNLMPDSSSISTLQGSMVLLQPDFDLNGGKPLIFNLSSQQLQCPAPSRKKAKALREWRSAALFASDSSNSVYWVDVNKSLGPLRLKRFGVGYQSGSLQLPFDVDVTMGGLDISLTQLSLSIPLNDFSSIGFSLQGMGLDYSAGGTFELGGRFLTASPTPAGYNTVSAALSSESFNIAAADFYGTIGASSSALKAPAMARAQELMAEANSLGSRVLLSYQMSPYTVVDSSSFLFMGFVQEKNQVIQAAAKQLQAGTFQGNMTQLVQQLNKTFRLNLPSDEQWLAFQFENKDLSVGLQHVALFSKKRDLLINIVPNEKHPGKELKLLQDYVQKHSNFSFKIKNINGEPFVLAQLILQLLDSIAQANASEQPPVSSPSSVLVSTLAATATPILHQHKPLSLAAASSPTVSSGRTPVISSRTASFYPSVYPNIGEGKHKR